MTIWGNFLVLQNRLFFLVISFSKFRLVFSDLSLSLSLLCVAERETCVSWVFFSQIKLKVFSGFFWVNKGMFGWRYLERRKREDLF